MAAAPPGGLIIASTVRMRGSMLKCPPSMRNVIASSINSCSQLRRFSSP
jgi:hypothetical protein